MRQGGPRFTIQSCLEQREQCSALPRLYVEPRWCGKKIYPTCQMNARVVAVVVESKIERCSISPIEEREVGDHHPAH